MNEIRLLDKNTIDKIAAGEVVDRPASIVKELVENAIDAGSGSISIEIRNGGKAMIRITDNGAGIKSSQVRTAFLRHSTSKISSASDLSFIHTLGFRGEALSSIAAVSRTELCTKTADEITGIIYKINGGTEESFEEAGLPEGTTVIIKDLFYNTPARLKFLKSDTTEGNYIMEVVQRIALSRPDISFKFTSNGALRLSTPGNASLKDTVYSIFGRDITSNLLEVDDKAGCMHIRGFIGKPEIARGNRNFEIFYVNGRYIKDRVVRKALEEAYAGYQMKGTFPFALLNIEIETELVDVNVHPSKMEVRFYNNEEVFHSIYQVIRDRITGRQSIPAVSLEQEKAGKEEKRNTDPRRIPEPFERKNEQPAVERVKEESGWPNAGAQQHFGGLSVKEQQDSKRLLEGLSSILKEEEPSYEQASIDLPAFLSSEARPKHRIIGCVFDTYWLVEYDQKLFIIDQHAAHEKVLYERFMKKLREDDHYSQKIVPALIITLSRQEADFLEAGMEQFTRLGYEISHFGGSEYAVSAVPTDLYNLDNRMVLVQMLDELVENPGRRDGQMVMDRIATAACKAAVKGGNVLSFAEADRLIAELLELDNPYNCPHGRPTIISMTKYELEKRFKRVI